MSGDRPGSGPDRFDTPPPHGETATPGIGADDSGSHRDEPRHGAFSWPPGDGLGVVSAFAETWRDATFRPASFFGRLPATGGMGPALVYYLVIGVIVAGIQLFWNVVLQAAGLRQPLPWPAELGGVGPWMDIISFLLSPLILLVLLLASGGVTHLLLLLFGGAHGGFQRTLQVFAYAYSPQTFAVVPWIGPVVGSIWMVVIAVIGLREGHGTDGWRAALAVLLPVAAALGFFVVLGLIAGLAMGGL